MSPSSYYNIAKFNYNEIPCAYTTFEHGFLLENTKTGNNQQNQNTDIPMVAVYPEYSISQFFLCKAPFTPMLKHA